MWQGFLSFFRIPPEIREGFWQDALQKNRLSLLVICIMIFGMEPYNMARVLLWSSSGLGTQLIRQISQITWQGQGLRACCSVDICRVERPGVPYDQLHRQADRAMYQAKGEGKGRCRLCAL